MEKALRGGQPRMPYPVLARLAVDLIAAYQRKTSLNSSSIAAQDFLSASAL